MATKRHAEGLAGDDQPGREPKRQRVASPSPTKGSREVQPWNQDHFFKRVQSFSVVNWFNKPEEISALEVARCGWICTGVDTLKCQHCGSMLKWKASAKLNRESVKLLAGQFKINLLATHSASCTWRNNPSPETFTTLPKDSSLMRNVVLNNFKSWLGNSSVDHYTVPTLAAADRQQLTKEFRPPPDNPDGKVAEDTEAVPNEDALILASCGWKLTELPNEQLLPSRRDAKEPFCIIQCAYCNVQRPLNKYDTMVIDKSTAREQSVASLDSNLSEDINRLELSNTKRHPFLSLFPTTELRDPPAFKQEDDLWSRPSQTGFHSWPRNVGKVTTLKRKSSRNDPSVAAQEAKKRRTASNTPKPRMKRRLSSHDDSGKFMISAAKRPRPNASNSQASSDSPSRPRSKLKRHLDVDGDTQDSDFQREKRARTQTFVSSHHSQQPLALVPTGTSLAIADTNLSREPSARRKRPMAHIELHPLKRARYNGTRSFNPIGEHRCLCPYVKNFTTVEGHTVVGWKHALRCTPTQHKYLEAFLLQPP